MVLFKRKPVQFLPNPDIDDSSQEVWVIPQTSEVFTSYESYLARIDFYKQKRFICEITGHSNLTFFEAHHSETIGSKDVEETFPEALKEPILRKVQFQTISRVDNLVDHLFELFKSDFYPGERVTAFLPNGDRTEAIVREKSKFPELRDPATNDIQRKAYSCYVVQLPQRGDAEVNLKDEELARDRKIFTKAMLRSFIKNTVSREAWNGAPWVVKTQYAKKYNIDSRIPASLMRGSTAAERKAALARRKEEEAALLGHIQKSNAANTNGNTSASVLDIRPSPTSKSHKSKLQQAAKSKATTSGSPSTPGETPERDSSGGSIPPAKMVIKQELKPVPKPPPVPVIRYPIEDLQVPAQAVHRSRPRLHFLTSLGFHEDVVHFILDTWVFLNIYCEPLLLDSFTFDDYIDALRFGRDDFDCELIVEIHCALLKGLVGEGENGKIEVSLPELPESDDEDSGEDSDQNEDSEPSEEQVQVKPKTKSKAKDADDDVMMEDAETAGDKASNAHRARELFADGSDWITRLRRREFRNGGWQTITVGLLDQLSILPKHASDCNKVLSYLAPASVEPTPEDVKKRYASLDVNLKVKIIKIFVGLIYDAPLVRKYMEECAEAMTELRKKKIEHQRTRKVYLEELRAFEDERKILLPENTPRSTSPDHCGASISKSEENERTTMASEEELYETGDDTDNRRSLRRDDERANARKRKREQDKERAEAAAKQPKTSLQFQRVLKNIEKTKNKISKEEEEIATIDVDLREADCARLRLLGKDRFYNRYWWFERNGMPYGGLPTSSTADSGYANGRLWIQGPSDMEREGFLERGSTKCNFNDGERMEIDNGTSSCSSHILDRQEREEGGTSLKYPYQFGYYETPEEFETLVEWLDARGERELKLRKELDLHRKKIVEGMVNRKKYLEQTDDASDADSVVVTRMSTRAKANSENSSQRFLRWRNLMAIKENGHTHHDHPVKKPKGRKGENKTLSRQGTRYNF